MRSIYNICRILLFIYLLFLWSSVAPINGEEAPKKSVAIPVILDAFNADYRAYGFGFDCHTQEADEPILQVYTNRSKNKCLEKHQFFTVFLRGISQNWHYLVGSQKVCAYDMNNELVYSVDSSGHFHCYPHATIHFREGEGVW